VKVITLMVVAALGVGASGCTVRGGVYAATPASRVEVYEPMYYNQSVVYYDDGGAPYYYQGDSVIYVPRTHASFNVYVGHYHSHRASYRHWYKVEGARHRHVRRPDVHPHRKPAHPNQRHRR